MKEPIMIAMKSNETLSQMTLAELEALRQTWKSDAQELFTPFIPAFLSGWRMSYRQERTRKIGSITSGKIGNMLSGEVKIDIYDTSKKFDVSKNAFLHRLSIQVFVGKEQVVNLIYMYFDSPIIEGEWQEEIYLFARPHLHDWVGTIQVLTDEYLTDSRSIELKKEEMQRQKLLDLLTKGKL